MPRDGWCRCASTPQFLLPSAKRCYGLGRAVGQAIQSWDSNKKVAVIASRRPQPPARRGARALLSTKTFDLRFHEPDHPPEWLTQFGVHELVEKTGTQGVGC